MKSKMLLMPTTYSRGDVCVVRAEGLNGDIKGGLSGIGGTGGGGSGSGVNGGSRGDGGGGDGDAGGGGRGGGACGGRGGGGRGGEKGLGETGGGGVSGGGRRGEGGGVGGGGDGEGVRGGGGEGASNDTNDTTGSSNDSTCTPKALESCDVDMDLNVDAIDVASATFDIITCAPTRMLAPETDVMRTSSISLPTRVARD